jgi:phosphate transport system protein
METHDRQLDRDEADVKNMVILLYREVEKALQVAIDCLLGCDLETARFVSEMAIASELERIGDYAAGIAEIILRMNAKPHPDFVGAIESMGQECLNMLSGVMKAYKILDEDIARKLAARDQQIDQGERRITTIVLDHMCDHPQDIESGTYALWIVHSIERVADRATNIAERIVYMASGEMVDLNT